MGYSVLQTSTKRVSERRLIAAYASIESLTHLDAKRRAKGAAGWIAQRLAHDEAWALLEGLAAQGVPAAIVPDEEVLDLPRPMSCRGAHLYPDRLELMDALNRLVPHDWADVTLVGGGRLVESYTRQASPFVQDTVHTQYGAIQVNTAAVPPTEVRRQRSLVELHFADGGRRVFEDVHLVRLHEGVQPPACEDPPERLAVAAATLAPAALVNTGVEAAVQYQRFKRYRNEGELARELRWLRWLAGA